jgi:hypothetical protein
MKPRTLIIDAIRAESGPRAVALEARLTCPSLGFRDTRLWFTLPPGSPVEARGDPFAAALLAPAAAAAARLRVEGPLSPALAANLRRASEHLAGWDPPSPLARFRSVDLVASRPEEAPPGLARRGLFFSGGVDSLYGVVTLSREALPPDLITIQSFGSARAAREVRRIRLENARAAAAALGAELVEVETNLKRITDPLLGWDLAHGGALAAVGLALGGRYRWIGVATDDASISGQRAGTVPELIPLWSRRHLAFFPVGSGVRRSDKLAALSANDTARRHLAVCWQSTAGTLNCGRCVKCLRTMLQLEVLGALEAFSTLPAEIPLDDLDRLLEAEASLFPWADLAEALAARPGAGELAARVSRFLARSRAVREPVRRRDLILPSGWRKLATRLRWLTMRDLPPPLRARLWRVTRGRRHRAGGADQGPG